jgi:lysophospholipase L1-like esterase
MKLLLRTSLALLLAVVCGCSSTPTAPSRPQPQPPPSPSAFAISCPTDVSASTPEGTQVAVSFNQATTSGGVAPVQVACTRQSGSMFAGGTTPVQCTATDATGQSTSCVFNVTVTVTVPPLTRTRFLAFGDSLTAGEVGIPISISEGRTNFRFIVDLAAAYPSKLRNALRGRYTSQAAAIDVVNGGLPGEWAQDGAKRLEQVLPTTRPEVVIILEGINDIASLLNRGVTSASTAIERMSREARNRGSNVILATLPPCRPPGDHAVSDTLIRDLNSRIRMIAAGENAVLVDLYAGMSTDVNRYIGADGLHPTAAGYERMAELLSIAIRANFESKVP